MYSIIVLSLYCMLLHAKGVDWAKAGPKFMGVSSGGQGGRKKK